MSMEYIRNHYGIPAKRGAEIMFLWPNHQPVKMAIIGSKGNYIKCRILSGPNAGAKTLLHPNWEIEYL